MRLIFFIFIIFFIPSSANAKMTLAHDEMVVTEHQLASKVGLQILQRGGNAFDAAVAVGYALAVVNPCCGNIGGGGFMIAHLANDKNIFVNFREKAPLKSKPNMYWQKKLDATSYGYLAVGIPGTVAGLDYILQRYGTMTREEVLRPAIDLAKKGFVVSSYLSDQLQELHPILKDQPNVAAIFAPNGISIKPNQILIQNNLANTLTLIAKNGSQVFYYGQIAKQIVASSAKHNGILSLADFAQYKVKENIPIQCNYHEYKIIAPPPPSSGGVALCEMLNILENLPLRRFGLHSAQTKQFIIEAMRYAFDDRNTKLGDPEFVNNPVTELLAKDYAKNLSDTIINTYYALPPKRNIPHPELTDTTHYSIVDRFGNAVAITYTLNGLFGARVIAGDTGFFLNNEMDDFATHPGVGNKFGLVQASTNDVQPQKQPLSSMTPTIVMKDDKVILVLGSPGGPRIITSVLLTLLNIFDFKMNLDEAINYPRFHYQGLPNSVDMEPFAFSYLTNTILRLRNYRLETLSNWSAVEGIYIDPINKKIYGANDYRRPDGSAEGI